VKSPRAEREAGAVVETNLKRIAFSPTTWVTRSPLKGPGESVDGRAMIELQGRILDKKYRLVRLIGEGGMGSVWEAEHVMISRRAAVKVMHARSGDQRNEAMRRFFLEAQAASAIGHPNIIEIYDVGVEDDSTAFIVMELLSGASLETLLLDRGPIPAPRAVGIILQVLSALNAAHKKGIIHRDIKPENIFLAVDARMREEVKLLDFGVAKIVQTEGEAVRITQTGSAMGTPCYMSPEQARGERQVDARIDIWAIGVILYEVMSGRLPFHGESYNEVIGKILLETPPPLAALVPGVSPELVAVVEKAMAKDRNARFKNVGEMIRALMPIYDAIGGDLGPAVTRAVRASQVPAAAAVVPRSVTADADALLDSTLDGTERIRKRRWRVVYTTAAIAATLGITALAIGLSLRGGEAKTPPVESSGIAGPPTAPVPASVPAAIPPAEPMKPHADAGAAPEAEKVTIRLDGLPPRARVVLDGAVVTTPLLVPRSAAGIALEAAAPGYAPQRLVVVPDADKAVTFRMSKLASGAAGGGKPGGGKKPGWKQNPFD
jgi:serine/threonine-protein kinase